MDREAIKKRILENAYGNAAPLNAGTITLGCEFEFVLMYHRPEETKSEYEPKHGVNLIVNTLSQPQNMICADAKCKERFKFSLPVIPSDGDQYDNWQVGEDQSVVPHAADLSCLEDSEESDNEDNFQFDPIEVRSRILRYNETAERASQHGKHEHWITFHDEITLVLSLLNETFGFGRKENVGSKYHILATAQCGFHVHIANGRDLSVPFKTAKRVYSTFVACERQLDRLVGTRDITGIKLATQAPKKPISGAIESFQHLVKPAYNKPVSVWLIIAAYMRRQWEQGSANKPLSDYLKGNKAIHDQLYPQTASKIITNFDEVKFGMDIDSWLMLVEGAKDSVDLSGLNCLMDKQCTLNMKYFPSEPSLPTRMMKPLPQDPVLERLLTIEFRQHAGTLLAVEVLSFIDFVVNLVLRCHNIKEGAFQMLIKPGGKLRQPKLTALDLLEFVGCSRETYDFYESQILSENSPVTKQLDLEESNVLKYEEQIPVAKYVLSQMQKLRKSIDPEEVDKLIMKKLLTGGYGQYSAEDLEVLLPPGMSDTQREQLTIGFRVPLNFADIDDDDNRDWSPKPLARLRFDDRPQGESAARFQVDERDKQSRPSTKDCQRADKPDKKQCPKKPSLKWQGSKIAEHNDDILKGCPKEKKVNPPKSNFPKQPNPHHRDDKPDSGKKKSATGSDTKGSMSSNRHRA